LRARNNFLNIAGDMPVWRLKVFEKWLWSEKPAASAISTNQAPLLGQDRMGDA
jgi:hypothetical protein